MGRMPYNIHVFLYRKQQSNYEYAIFQRADLPAIWQGICGGGESGETVEQSALRECMEEGGITAPGPLHRLDSISYMRSSVFAEWVPVWGADVVVLPMYFFAMPYNGEITLSDEHLQFAWMDYQQANSMITMPDQNVALWELNQRLLRNNLIR